MRNRLRILIPYIIISIVLIISLIKVYADYLYNSNNVYYNNTSSNLEASDVQSAIDELYEKANTCASSSDGCPVGYRKYNEDSTSFLCAKPLCKRATSLHIETCSQTSSYCYADEYYASGSEGTSTITYGQLGTSGSEPSAGDAFDCDVNGDGVYDSERERFYYVSTYFDTSTKNFDNDYYVFIYYSNTSGGNSSTSTVAWYSSSNSTSYGPTTAMAQLPKTSGENAWRDDLLKTTTRNILSGTSVTSVTGTAKSNFSYSGYAARLLTMQELLSGCPNASTSTGSLKSCNWIMEQTKYSTSSYSTSGPWLESAYSSTRAWFVNSGSRRVYYTMDGTTNSSNYGARPVIEIPKSQVSY